MGDPLVCKVFGVGVVDFLCKKFLGMSGKRARERFL